MSRRPAAASPSGSQSAPSLALLCALLLPLVLVGAGCQGCTTGGIGGGDGGDGDGGLSGVADGGGLPIAGAIALSIDPASITLVTDGVTRPLQGFRVNALLDDGSSKDVTGDVALSLSNPALGELVGAAFRSAAIGGTSQLIARAGDLSATAPIVVRLEAAVNEGDDLPADPVGVFDSAPLDDSRAPQLVYPTDGVLVPPNLGLLEVHFYPGSDNELFAVTYDSPLAHVVVYTRCTPLGGGCVYTPSTDVWRYVADTNRGADAPMVVSVRATDDEGTGQGASGEVDVHVSAVDVAGALYYWSTTQRAIMRVDFGDEVPERFFPPEGQGGTCYGCHSLSPDGTRMSLSQQGQYNGQLTILDVGSQSALLTASDETREQFQAWDPTSTMFAAIYGDDDPPDTHLRIRDGDTGAVLDELDIGQEISHPHWSPAGDRIAFTVVTHHQTSQRPGRGGISYVEQEAGGWSAPHELLPPTDGLNRYTPVYSPDGSYLVYVESTCPAGVVYDGSCDADADDVAKLWAIAKDGGAPIALTAAGTPGPLDDDDDLANTFPRWAPFEDVRFTSGEGRVHWMTFSSRRRYGLRDPEGRQLLWMVAVDPDRVAAGQDGSFPAFALPFQDLATSNHMAQWAEVFVPTEPEPDAGPDPEQCLGPSTICDPAASDCCEGLQCIAGEAAAFCVVVGG